MLHCSWYRTSHRILQVKSFKLMAAWAC